MGRGQRPENCKSLDEAMVVVGTSGGGFFQGPSLPLYRGKEPRVCSKILDSRTVGIPRLFLPFFHRTVCRQMS